MHMELMDWLNIGAAVIIVIVGFFIYQNKKNG